jgi:hypothetical protein
MMRNKEKQEVLIGITLTHQTIHLGKRAIAQVHILLEIIRGGLGWTSYREK